MSDTNPASTEASEPRWRSFLSVLAVVLVGILGVVAAFIFVMDPHDHIIGSPEFKRAPIKANQHYSYPALARKPHFDSAIIGTCLLYTSPSPRDKRQFRMPSSA